jgi:putative ABC transport system ATP-binding protein
MSIIELNVKKKSIKMRDREITIIHDLSLRVEEGEMIAIMGPSGSGKSTLLHIIGCLDYEYDGEYRLYDFDVLKNNKKQATKLRLANIGFVFQDFLLMEQFSVYENIEMPLKARGESAKKRKEKINDQLKKLGLEHLKNTSVKYISGGEKQRCAIARAMVTNPRIILADEPTGSLDSENGKIVMEYLRKMNEAGATVIIVTHDDTVASFCNKKMVIKDGTWVDE